jgi:type VI secretion system secreted protein VgrG
VRCSQGWAGGGYGMLFLPRVGQEVIVDFLEGNPDRPIITGRVYNNDNMPPYLPDSKTISTIKTNSSVGGAGSNEIRFDDAKDAEQLLFHAQKDLHLRVKNDRVENVEHDRHLTVAGNKTEKVQGDRNLTVEGNLKEAIQADVSTDVAGKVSEHVAGTLSLTVDGDVVEALGANHKHEVAQTYAVSGANIKLEATTEIELVCGSCSIQLTSAGLFIAGQPLLNLNSGTGPPVAPVTAQATTPEAPDAPIDADEVEFGQDTTYAGEQREFDQVEAGAVAAGTLPPERVPVETTWIEIELINEADEPVPGERYELLLPDGKTRTGSLDANGKAHVDGLEPGTCQICFPRLDAEAWERI